MNAQWLRLLMLGMCVAAPAVGADVDKDADDSGGKPPAVEPSKETDAQADKLAAEFKVPESQITTLRAQGLGWGEIRHALAISQKAGVPVSDVLALRSQHMGWGKIAHKYGFRLGDVTGKGHEESRVDRHEDRREDRREERREDRRERRQDRHEMERGEMHDGGGPHGRS